MPPPLPPSELGHSLGPRDARVTLGGHLDYVVRTPGKLAHSCSLPCVLQHLHKAFSIERHSFDLLRLLCAVPILQENLHDNTQASGASLSKQEVQICFSPSSTAVSDHLRCKQYLRSKLRKSAQCKPDSDCLASQVSPAVYTHA